MKRGDWKCKFRHGELQDGQGGGHNESCNVMGCMGRGVESAEKNFGQMEREGCVWGGRGARNGVGAEAGMRYVII